MSNPRWQNRRMVKIVNDRLMRVEPGSAWNQGGELRQYRRGSSRVQCASLSGRREQGWITRAFRPCRIGVYSMVREGVPFGQKRAGTWVQLGKGGQEVERWRSFSRF